MQRFRQPHKIQGPLFPIEDDELIDAINDNKNTPDEDYNFSKDCDNKSQVDKSFNAANYVEVIEIDDIYEDTNGCIDENDACSEEYNKENVFKNIQKSSEKTVNMYCK